MIIQSLKREEGVFTAFFIIMMLTLALLGIGATVVLRNESRSVSDQHFLKDADYSAESAVYFAMDRVRLGYEDESENITINGYACEYSIQDSGTSSYIIASAQTHDDDVTSDNDIVSTITVLFSLMDYSDFGFLGTKDISGVLDTYDEDGNPDDNLQKDDLDESDFPTIDLSYYDSLATVQGNNLSGGTINWSSDYPPGATDFWLIPDSIPNVTYVRGNLNVKKFVTIYGIFIVEGDYMLYQGSTVNGIIYQPNADWNKYRSGSGKDCTINGGVITNGYPQERNKGRTGIYHMPEYLREFYEQIVGEMIVFTDVKSWEYSGA